MAASATFTAAPAAAASTSSVATFTNVAIGTASADRIVAVCCTAQANANFAACTVGGIAGIERIESIDAGSNPDIVCAIYLVRVPTGTTATITVTLSTGDATVGISVYEVHGAEAFPLFDVNSANGSAATISTALTVTTGGVGIVAWANNTQATACTWTNATEQADYDAGIHRHSSAIITDIGAITVTADGATANQAIAGLTFRPGKEPATANLVLSSTAPILTVAATARIDVSWFEFEIPSGPFSPAGANLLLSGTAPTATVTTAGGVSISPATAKDVVLSSIAPTVATTVNISALPVGANLAISSTAPAVATTANVSALPAAVDLVLSGTAPAVSTSAAFSLSPAAANLAISSVAPSVSASADISQLPAAANLLLGATAPSVATSGSFSLSPAAANLFLSGGSPSFGALARVDVSWFEFEVPTGANEITPPSANLFLSGQVPSFSSPLARIELSWAVYQVPGGGFSPAAANLVLSSTAVSISGGLTPVRANLVLSSTAPVVAQTTAADLSPAAANLTLSSTEPFIGQQTTGNLLLSSEAPVVFQTMAIVISPAAGQLNLTAAAPGLVQVADHFITPSAANIVISPTAPIGRAGKSIVIPAGNLRVSGSVPTAFKTGRFVISPPAAQLQISSIPLVIPIGDQVIVDTDMLQLPVDYVLAGDQVRYTDRGNIYQGGNTWRTTNRTVGRISKVKRLSGSKPSSTTTTNKKGYD